MRTFSIDVTAEAKSLKVLIQDPTPRHTACIGLQAPEANASTVFFGNDKCQTVELRPKANASLPIASFDSTYIKGTVGDKVTVVLFDH